LGYLDKIKHNRKKKIALIRMDRMGDLMCTLPVDQNYQNHDKYQFTWIISTNLGFILENIEPEREYQEFSVKFSKKQFYKFVDYCKQFDGAIIFHAPAWVSVALWWAGVSHRFGPRSKLHQFLFLNHTLNQKRSASYKHEADYNFDLFKWAIDTHANQTPFLRFRDLHLTHAPVSSLLQKPYIVIHPGMGGSALNWPQSHYIELIQIFLKKSYVVVITGTEIDIRWLTEISEYSQNEKNICWLVGKLNGLELIAVLKQAKAVVAPSTGVAHLAAACGVKTLGLYSPIKVQSATRWAPRGPYALALTPQVECKVARQCAQTSCSKYPCLDRISPISVAEALSLPQHENLESMP
jgi:ADP-heptose:LPS heptosyltransferase